VCGAAVVKVEVRVYAIPSKISVSVCSVAVVEAELMTLFTK
jgi:hypothetical protein